jgi:hypothetical protein
MLFDSQTLMAGAIAADGTRSGQAITATAVSTNIIDTRQPNGGPTLVNLGLTGTPVYLVVQVLTAFNNLTSLATTLESSANTSLTSSTVHATATTLLAGLTAGAVIAKIPLPLDNYQRYLGVRFTVTGTAPSTGSVVAFLTLDPNVQPVYPSGFTVDA